MSLINKLLFLVLVGLLTVWPPLTLSPVQAAGLTVSGGQQTPAGGSVLGALLATLAAVGMAIRIKDTGSIAKKFVSRAGQASGEYSDGVKSAGGDWETNTKNSEENYKIGVTQAANDGRFGRGVSAAGGAKYVEKASTLGAQRYPTGVAASEGAYARGVQPHLDMMKSLDLPPRRPKGDPGNQQRAAVVAAANRKLKLGK